MLTKQQYDDARAELTAADNALAVVDNQIQALERDLAALQGQREAAERRRALMHQAMDPLVGEYEAQPK